jgi:hypothetical protein
MRRSTRRRPSRLAEPVIGPAEGRTRWLAPQGDGFGRLGLDCQTANASSSQSSAGPVVCFRRGRRLFSASFSATLEKIRGVAERRETRPYRNRIRAPVLAPHGREPCDRRPASLRGTPCASRRSTAVIFGPWAALSCRKPISSLPRKRSHPRSELLARRSWCRRGGVPTTPGSRPASRPAGTAFHPTFKLPHESAPRRTERVQYRAGVGGVG